MWLERDGAGVLAGAAGLLLGLWACSSGGFQQPEPDPELVAAWLERQAEDAARARDEAAADAEKEQLVLAILSEPAEPARVLEVSEVYAVFGYYCGDCHPTEKDFVPVASWDGMYMRSLVELIQTGKITPGAGEASRLVLRVRQGDMPPVSSAGPRMPDAMTERLVDFIDSLPTTRLPEDTEQR
ncbi:MAG: hypothetical protein ABI895_20585 [Deltaproteobacteria bacterium]